jgi:hypothetical protein
LKRRTKIFGFLRKSRTMTIADRINSATSSNQMDPKISSSQEAVAPPAGSAGNSKWAQYKCAQSLTQTDQPVLSARALNIDSISWRTSPSGSTGYVWKWGIPPIIAI